MCPGSVAIVGFTGESKLTNSFDGAPLRRSSVKRSPMLPMNIRRAVGFKRIWVERARDNNSLTEERGTYPRPPWMAKFDGSIEGEDVGLESDLVDDLDDLGDLLAGGVDAVHGDN